MQSSISLLLSGNAADCEVDLLCAFHETFDAAQPFEEGARVLVEYSESQCFCEEVRPDTFDQYCDDSPPTDATVWIEAVTDDCITGALQGPEDEEPRPFVATVCCTGAFC